jgi:hypothetical protein
MAGPDSTLLGIVSFITKLLKIECGLRTGLGARQHEISGCRFEGPAPPWFIAAKEMAVYQAHSVKISLSHLKKKGNSPINIITEFGWKWQPGIYQILLI